MSTNAKPYKETLNLPVTRFDMKANLTAKEPTIQARWRERGLYEQVRSARAGSPKGRRVLHDGPPYANGEIHMGHLLNKVLKDLVVRYLNMRGYDSPYVPGWDCHGLPIEHKVVKDLGSKAAGMDHTAIRALCHAEAMKWVGVQRDQFRRLGIEGDWDNPYLTLDPRYEAGVLDVLADLVAGGYVFRQLKPIHWCIQDRTALAEAELEYSPETSPSIYVRFPIESGLPASLGAGPWHAMIWTTTPWTLPANVAIAAHPDLDYAAVRYTDPDTGAEARAILAADLVPRVMALRQVADFAEVGRLKGRELEGVLYRHVFLDRTGPIVLASYVSADDGTGLVHTAPGHGHEDYQTGQAYGLPTLCPVDASGRFTAEAPEGLVGKGVFAANPQIVQMIRDAGALYHSLSFEHSYPHCWRCKKPVIFRATAQWFIGVDRQGLRGKTLEVIAGAVRWQPAWGQARIEAMVGGRPDWCISRQRSWGVPIPAFECVGCGEMLLTADSVRHVRDRFRAEGADAWYRRPAAELLPPGATCAKCGGSAFEKTNDILDVWFESGSSHRSVLGEPSFGLGFPAFLYLEGSDQHRGWFQSSILTSVATTGRAPFEAVLTHGFVVDDKGQKQSKSQKNAVGAVEATEKYGADVLRLMVASLDYANDVALTERAIKEASEAYRKIRNTFRFLLGNLEDYAAFDPTAVDPSTLHEIDRWALGRLNTLIREVTEAYERFEFYRACGKLYQFCAVELSSFYLDVLKDRLYAESPVGPDRRAAQFVLARLHGVLARLLAPIIPHTAEEVWDFLPASADKPESVHLADWPEPDPRWDDAALLGRWAEIQTLRTEALVALERLRKDKQIGSGQEAIVRVSPARELLDQLDPAVLAVAFGVSAVEVHPGPAPAEAARSPDPKCERCWNSRPTVGQDPAHPTLCDRCARVVAELPIGN